MFIGGCIYVFFRSTDIIFFRILEFLKLDVIILPVRRILQSCFIIPSWIKFSLPDGLYIFSISNYFLDTEISRRRKALGFLIVLIVSEIMQLPQMGIFKISGTFDILDIYFYIGGYVLSYIIYFLKLKDWEINYYYPKTYHFLTKWRMKNYENC